MTAKRKAKKPTAAKAKAKKPVIKSSALHPVSRVLARTFDALSGLPKDVAVAVAVGTQLTREKRWPPNDANRTMISYRYDVNTMTNFLNGVRATLASGGWRFDFDAPFVAAALPLTAPQLAAAINAKTK